MARRRFFVDAIRGGTAELNGEDARHLTRVLRAEAGTVYEITDSQAAYLAEITQARGDRVTFRVLEPLPVLEFPVHITLLASLIKFDRFEWTVEKATEMGVERIVPVEAARTEKGLYEAASKRAERWRRIARESSQQCRRVRAPEIGPAVRFAAALQESADYRYALEEETAPPLLRILPANRPRLAHTALLVGPEGGWTGIERGKIVEAGWQPVSLGPQILRAETAAIAGVAILVNAWCG